MLLEPSLLAWPFCTVMNIAQWLNLFDMIEDELEEFILNSIPLAVGNQSKKGRLNHGA
jgi:hypothetical protein